MAEKHKQQQMKEGFNLLPEDCISAILSFTSPRDVFRSSLVSTIFKCAAESDSVWENFLPSIYPEIISRSSSSSSSLSSSSSSSSTPTTSLLGGFSSKKDLYCKLSDKPVLIDGGLKSFGLEKGSGKICLGLGARNLSIRWGRRPQYWAWEPSSSSSSSYDSRFPEVAKLLEIWWFEITGKVETRMLSPKTTYGAYFVIKIMEDNYGLGSLPIKSSVTFVRGGGKCTGEYSVFLRILKRRRQQDFLHKRGHGWKEIKIRGRGECSGDRLVFLRREGQQEGEEYILHERGDGWMEIEMGEFYNDGEEDGEVEMRLLETDGNHKEGLIVQGMELRPKL